MRGLREWVVIITGGSGGIGSATARRLGEDCAKVAVLDIDGKAAASAAADVVSAGGVAQPFTCDITDYAGVARAAEAALGPAEVLVNNAGWDVFRPFLKTAPSDWERLIAINLVGALNLHHVVLPGMVACRFGRVVNIASDAAQMGSSGEAVYAACKAGLLGLSKTLALAFPTRHHRQRRLSRPDRHRSLRGIPQGRRQSGEARRGLPPRHPDGTDRQSRRPARRRLLFRER